MKSIIALPHSHSEMCIRWRSTNCKIHFFICSFVSIGNLFGRIWLACHCNLISLGNILTEKQRNNNNDNGVYNSENNIWFNSQLILCFKKFGNKKLAELNTREIVGKIVSYGSSSLPLNKRYKDARVCVCVQILTFRNHEQNILKTNELASKAWARYIWIHRYLQMTGEISVLWWPHRKHAIHREIRANRKIPRF